MKTPQTPHASDCSPNLQKWLDHVAVSLQQNHFVKVSIGHYTGKKPLRRLLFRRITLRDQPYISLVCQGKQSDEVQNLSMADALEQMAAAFASGFRIGTLFSLSHDWTYERAASGRDWLRQKTPTHQDIPSTSHDRIKARLIAPSQRTWLIELGITDQKGCVKPSGQNKYRQINRFVEILAPLISDDMRTVADMGCGKGYLTFSLYEYMHRVRHLTPIGIGIDQRLKLVQNGNRIATASGFDGLSFKQGTIADFDATGIDILIALHACDTATDDAIAKGIEANAKLIVVAPCCHKQIRREMDQPANRQDFLLRHGIFMEREAEMVTDAIRALLLEASGYRVKVFEFISDTHTPKNIMITAVRDPKIGNRERQQARQMVNAAMKRYDIQHHALDAHIAQE